MNRLTAYILAKVPLQLYLEHSTITELLKRITLSNLLKKILYCYESFSTLTFAENVVQVILRISNIYVSQP